MKNMFPDEIFEGIDKKDGYIALIFYVIEILLITVYTYITKEFLISDILSEELRQLISGSCFYIVNLIMVFILLRIRKQKLSTIGLRRKGLITSLGIGFVLNIIVLIILMIKGQSVDKVIYNFFFYQILGFSEEIAYRGFIWPRLVVLFDRKFGTIVCGALFGIMHAPFRIIMYGTPVISSIINQIGGGVVVSLVFVFIYTRNKNIVLPSLIHGVVDFSGGLNI